MTHEARALTNQLFYRNGLEPQPLLPSDAMLVADTFDQARNATIEECAQEVDRIAVSQMRQGMMGARARDRLIEAAAAIRALKDKP